MLNHVNASDKPILKDGPRIYKFIGPGALLLVVFGRPTTCSGACIMKRYTIGLICLMLFLIPAWAAGGEAITQRPPDFVDVTEVVPSIVQDIRYYTSHNFVGRPVDGYEAPLCLLTKPAAEALAKVQADLADYALSLKVYDCYRPQRAVNHFIRWAADLDDTLTKAEFYPTMDKRNLFKDGYIASRSGHSRGSSVDLTIVPLPVPVQEDYRPGRPLQKCFLPQDQRFQDNSLDMGTGFDCFHELSHTNNPEIGPVPRRHRLLLKTLMQKHGFKNYHKEWWHYTLKNEPYPDTYFDFPIR